MKKIVLFTDLDGTLIDHHTYSPSVAQRVLKKLVQKDVPVVFCSSKTFAEQLYLQKKLGLNHPFIIENGSAIAIPKGYFPGLTENTVEVSAHHELIVLAKKNVSHIENALTHINKYFKSNLFGYAQIDDQLISSITGLKGNAVKRAKNRLFTESLLSGYPSWEALKMLDSFGLRALQGGRFYTVQDKIVDKGKAVKYVADLFQFYWQESPLTIGIGDSPNDESFLKMVDQPYLVQKHDRTWADIKADKIKRINAVGPNGFIELITHLL
jgi:mannosyl-3-phosphoglycerate phosphatase family protein